MTAPDALQTERLRRAAIVRDNQCTTCGGAITDISGVFGCAKHCRPAGYVKRSDLEQATHAALTLADEAGVREPWLSKDRPTVAGQRPGLLALFGKDKD